MKKAITIDKNDISGVCVSDCTDEQSSINTYKECVTWTCNVCGSGLKWNCSSNQTSPSCVHYAFTSCRNCQYFEMSNNACDKK